MEVEISPMPNDPDRDIVSEVFTLDGERWHMTDEGDYKTAAAILADKATGKSDMAVILEWPARINKTTERLTLRMAISPEDAVGLAKVLAHTGLWILERGKKKQ